jgi:hypothetical protein
MEKLWESMAEEINAICKMADYYLSEEELNKLRSNLLDNAQIELEKKTRHEVSQMRELVIGK